MAQAAAYIYTAAASGPEREPVPGSAGAGPVALIKHLIGAIDRPAGAIELNRLALTGLNLEQAVDLSANRAGEQLDQGRFVLFLGDEHTVSLGAILAHARRENRFGVLLLTARPDLDRPNLDRPNRRRAETARRILEAGVKIIGIGDRAFSSSERRCWDRAEVTVVRPDRATRPGWPDRLIQTLPPKVYLSLDLNFGKLIPRNQPVAADGPGRPPGPARAARQIEPLIDRLFAARRVIGADLIEPTPTGLPGPNLIAARIISRLKERGRR